MTKCTRSEVNLKSSVYNITGQNYFEQLAAYNSMSQHLRKIFLAKSVVDARNKNYMRRKNKQSKPVGDKRVQSLPEMTDDIINKLTYDAQHHPMDTLRMRPGSEYLNYYNPNLDHRRSRDCGRSCCRVNDGKSYRQRSTSRSQRSASPTVTSKHKKFIPSAVYKKEPKSAQRIPYAHGSSVGSPRQREKKFRYETDMACVPCSTSTLHPSECKSCRSPIQETYDQRLTSSRTSRSDSDHDDKAADRSMSQKKDEKKYINFVYDITKEIMQSGLYTDKELQDVFKKHIDKNKGILNMNRMLYEIYQLKISLSILDEDMDDELEDLIHAQKLLQVSEIRPPTPPKVLDEDKVMEKLRCYQESIDIESMHPNNVSTKTVVLVDANPELLVTERDVLISLMEAGVDAKQAQRVCKSLFYKSKETKSLNEMVQAGAESSQLASFESRDDNKRLTLAVMMPSVSYTIEDKEVDHAGKQEASSSVSDLVTTQYETVETEEKIEYQGEPDSHKVKSEAEASYSSQFEKSEELLEDDRRTSLASSDASVKDHSADSSVREEVTSSASNVASTQDETIETEEKSESQTTSDGLKIVS